MTRQDHRQPAYYGKFHTFYYFLTAPLMAITVNKYKKMYFSFFVLLPTSTLFNPNNHL